MFLIDAVFKFRISWRDWIVAYVGSPSIGGFVEFLKLSTILSMEVADTC